MIVGKTSPYTSFFQFSVIAFILFSLNYWIGYEAIRSDFIPLIFAYGSYVGLYWWVCTQKQGAVSLFGWILLGVLLRLTLVFALPNLSDDIYRFIWDGRLLNHGINPFTQLPSYYIESYTGILLTGIDTELYHKLNSPNYFTIYPPIAQGVFAFATYLFPTNILGSTIVMKLFLFVCEIGTIYILYQLFVKDRQQVLWYALNPLIIIEVCGNVHFEGAMIFFLLLAYWLLQKYQSRFFYLSAFFFACSVASKLLPLMFLPFLISVLGWKRSIQYYIVVGISLLCLFYPILDGAFIQNFGNSLDLYFRRFEFNASLYYVLRWLGYQISGYNMIGLIGPMLASSVFIGILWMAFRKQKRDIRNLPKLWLWAILFYLLCTTTIHPWYTALPLVLCLFTPYRFPIAWSGLIFLTYINYSYESYHENLWMVGIEYLLVLLFFFDRKSSIFSC